MDKYDWLEMGMRVLGVWWVGHGVTSGLGVIALRGSMAGIPGGMNDAAGAALFVAIGTSLFGIMTVLLAPVLTGWLREMEPRARPRRKRTTPSYTQHG